MKEGKKALRRSMRVLRDKIEDEVLEYKSQQICESVLRIPQVVAAEVIFIYVSFRSEVQTHALIDRLLTLDKRLCVPHIDRNDRMQAALLANRQAMKPSAFGFLEPQACESEQGEIGVSIVPGLAFTQQGVRLGYGKGHYDRFFSSRLGGTKIGLALDAQIVEEIPTEPFDCPMDLVQTESNLFGSATQMS
ncbi:MAG: 5-formyltetrahydrofolate cyclo-ligase [Planctomycetota bacterium]|nr:5-formyltetrahydrofolate cyclo-ligase [Planctomycetota bacterium]